MKTKLGISAGLLAAIVYLAGLFGGYLSVFIVAGYILIVEQNDWLKNAAIKSLVLTFSFSVLYAVVGFIPDCVSIITNMLKTFNVSFYPTVLSNLEDTLRSIINVLEVIVFAILAFTAFRQKTFPIPGVDKIVDQNTVNN